MNERKYELVGLTLDKDARFHMNIANIAFIHYEIEGKQHDLKCVNENLQWLSDKGYEYQEVR